MDKQNTKVKMAAKMLLEFLLEHREALNMAAQQMKPRSIQQPITEEAPSVTALVQSDE